MLKAAQIFLVYFILGSFKTILALPMLESKADPIIIDDVAFVKLGTYRGFTDDGVEYQKAFFLQRYSKAPWAESKAICKAFGLELTSFETLAESREFLNMLETSSVLRKLENVWVYTDAITLSSIGSTTDWYWTRTGKKLSFPIDWYPGNPNGNNDEQGCLCVGRETLSFAFKYNDCYCHNVFKILCQRTEFFLSP